MKEKITKTLQNTNYKNLIIYTIGILIGIAAVYTIFLLLDLLMINILGTEAIATYGYFEDYYIFSIFYLIISTLIVFFSSFAIFKILKLLIIKNDEIDFGSLVISFLVVQLLAGYLTNDWIDLADLSFFDSINWEVESIIYLTLFYIVLFAGAITVLGGAQKLGDLIKNFFGSKKAELSLGILSVLLFLIPAFGFLNRMPGDPIEDVFLIVKFFLILAFNIGLIVISRKHQKKNILKGMLIGVPLIFVIPFIIYFLLVLLMISTCGNSSLPCT